MARGGIPGGLRHELKWDKPPTGKSVPETRKAAQKRHSRPAATRDPCGGSFSDWVDEVSESFRLIYKASLRPDMLSFRGTVFSSMENLLAVGEVTGT